MQISASDPSFEFETALNGSAQTVERRLAELLQPNPAKGEVARPERLVNAMRYAVLNGGKRLRPHLVLESTRLCDPEDKHGDVALSVAAALECVHCYSLVHDDLPAMDDDDMRRGMPTTHIAFDEATAILTGDALLTLAFDIVSAPALDLPADRKIRLVSALATAAGLGGMAGGQMLDLQAEAQPPDESGIIMLQAMKTGALIRFAVEAGAIIADRPDEERARLRQFGETIGLAFQLVDDMLDLTSSATDLGKATGKDLARGKATLVSMHGTAWAEKQIAGLVSEAETLLQPHGDRAKPLMAAARFVATRSR